MHNIRWRPVATAHVNVKSIREMQEHVYKDGPPHKNEFTVVVAVDKQWENVMTQHYGKLKRMPPEEPVFALILAAEAAKNTSGKKQFCRLMRAVHYHAVHMDLANPDCILRESINIRQRQHTATP